MEVCNSDSSLSLLEELDPQRASRCAKYEGFVVMKPLDSARAMGFNAALFIVSAFDPNEKAALLSRLLREVEKLEIKNYYFRISRGNLSGGWPEAGPLSCESRISKL